MRRRNRSSGVRRLADESVAFDPFSLSPIRTAVRSIEDRRTFHPLRSLRPAAALPRAASRLVVKSSAVNHFRDNLSARVGFAVPERVAVCVRRKERREVIHALNRSGGGGSRRRRRNNWSDVIC